MLQQVARVYELLRLHYAHPSREPITIGVMLLDKEQDIILTRFTSDWFAFDEEELVILSVLEQDLREKAYSMGASMLVRYLLDGLSNTISISQPELVHSGNPQAVLERYFIQHVGSHPTTYSPLLRVHKLISRHMGDRMRRAAILGSVAASILLGLVIIRDMPSVSMTPPSLLRPIEQDTFVSVRSLASVSRQPIASPPRRVTARMSRQLRVHRAGKRKAKPLPSVPFVPDPRVVVAPDVALVDVSEDEIVTSVPRLDTPVVATLELPGPPARRERRVLHTLAEPFRQIRRLLAD